jgi:hypothetical protein
MVLKGSEPARHSGPACGRDGFSSGIHWPKANGASGPPNFGTSTRNSQLGNYRDPAGTVASRLTSRRCVRRPSQAGRKQKPSRERFRRACLTPNANAGRWPRTPECRTTPSKGERASPARPRAGRTRPTPETRLASPQALLPRDLCLPFTRRSHGRVTSPFAASRPPLRAGGRTVARGRGNRRPPPPDPSTRSRATYAA